MRVCSRTGHQLVLASGSPRRRELMEALDISAEAVRPDDDEGRPLRGETPDEFVIRLSLDKARQVAGRFPNAIVLGADTAVVLDGDVLGKPADGADAIEMLRRLRGRVHTVVTGVTVLAAGSGRWLSSAKRTDVLMRRYSGEELAAYAASGDPIDKAGGYAVQHDGFRPAQEIRGCYLNVVGLPLCEVVGLLARLGVEARVRRDAPSPLVDRCRGCSLREGQEVFQA